MSDPSLPQARKGLSCLWIALAIFAGGTLLTTVLCCGTISWFTRAPRGSAASREPFSYAQVPLPSFPPDRGEPIRTKDDATISRYEILLGEQGGYYEKPGVGGRLWVYVPPGKHPPRSLACVLMAPDRYSPLVGTALNELDEDKQIPYVKAGYVVVAYEIDGRNDAEFSDDVGHKRQFEAFKNSCGGVVNARNALEYALHRIPEVNPRKVYAYGMGFGGTTALLFAAHEPRLAGVLALEPIVDTPANLGAVILRAGSVNQPDLVDFATQNSPHTHVARVKCPVFLFFEDEKLPLIAPQIPQAKVFVNQLKKAGTDATLTIVEAEFNGRKDEGIPPSIEWLKKQVELNN